MTVAMPKFYHYQNKKNSDRDWIATRMAIIPADKQREVAEEYELRYLIKDRYQGRKSANIYLQGVAVEYRDEMRRKGLI